MYWPALGCVILLPLLACGRTEAHQEVREPAGTAVLTAAADGGRVHLVRMVAQAGRYVFEPDEVRIRAGDVVRFLHVDHQPESIAFETAGLAPEAAAFVAAEGRLHGPLLTEPGAFYDVSFAGAPPGEYVFHSLPHRELGMRGRVIVEP